MKEIRLLFLFVILLVHAQAQWQQTNGPHTSLWGLTISGSKIFAGALGTGVYRSDIDSSNWILFNNGLTNQYVAALASRDSFIYAGSDGIYRSTDSGGTWTESHIGIPFLSRAVTALAIKGDTVLAGLIGGLFYSTDNGMSWTQFTNGIPPNVSISSVVYRGDTLFTGAHENAGFTVSGVFASTGNGASWTKMNHGLSDSAVHSLAITGNNLLAGTEHGVFVSNDFGLNWNADTTIGMGNRIVYALAAYRNFVFAGTDLGVFISSDSGITWNLDTLQYNLVTAFAMDTINIYLASNGGGVWKRLLSDFTLGQNTISIHPFVEIYPNPVTDILTVLSSTLPLETVEMSVVNILGDIVHVERIHWNRKYEINVSNFQSGMYFVRVKANDKILINKFVRE